MLMTCRYLCMEAIAYCLLTPLKVERAREKATHLGQRPGTFERSAPLFVLHRSDHWRGHNDCRDPRRQDARALCGDLPFCLDGADRRDPGGPGGRLLHRGPNGGPTAATRPPLRRHRGGGNIPLRHGPGRAPGGVLVPRIQTRPRFAVGLGASLLRAAFVVGDGGTVLRAHADQFRRRRRRNWSACARRTVPPSPTTKAARRREAPRPTANRGRV